jgi:hypothetical protein
MHTDKKTRFPVMAREYVELRDSGQVKLVLGRE